MYLKKTQFLHVNYNLNIIVNININENCNKIKRSLSSFDKICNIVTTKNSDLREENKIFIKQFKNAQDLKEYRKKRNRSKRAERGIFDDLIIQYKQRGYKIPNLSVEHNLFQMEPLLEENYEKIKDGFIAYPGISEKNFLYLKKLGDIVERNLNPSEYEKKEENLKKSNEKKKQKEQQKKKLEKLGYILSNKSTEEKIEKTAKKSVNNKTIKDINATILDSKEVKLKSFEINENKTINTLCKRESENANILGQIQQLLELIEMEANKNQRKEQKRPDEKLQTLQLKGPKLTEIQIEKDLQKTQIKGSFKLLNLKKNIFEEPLIYPKSINKSYRKNKEDLVKYTLPNMKRNSNKQKSSFNKRGSSPEIKMPKLAKEFNAMFRFNQFRSEEEFLRYAYYKLINGHYAMVFEMLKLYLQKYKNLNEKESEKLMSKRNLTPIIVLEDIEKLQDKLKRSNFPEKIKKLYMNSELFPHVLPKLTTLSDSEKKINRLDKTLCKTLSSKE